MAIRIRRAGYFTIDVEDKAGEGARMLGKLKDAQVSLPPSLRRGRQTALASIIAAGVRTRGCAVLAALPDPSGH